MTWRVAAVAVIMGTTGCSSVQPVREVAPFIAAASPEVVYVTHRNRALIAIANPRVSGDTVYGTWYGETRPVALPLSHVQSVAARLRDRKRTTLLVAGIAVLSGTALYALLQSANGHNNWHCDYNSAVPVCG